MKWRINKRDLLSVGLGQVLSLLITGTGVCSQLLAAKFGISIPTTQTVLNYVLLTIYLPILLYRNGIRWKERRGRIPIYFILALVDVEANYLVVKAYSYTTITSVMLLDCFAIPCVMILSRIFLKTRYTLRQLIGVGVCLVGLVVLVVSDYFYNEHETAKNALLGDLLCICGAILYSISNVSEEYMVKTHTRMEWLGMIGVGGSIISAIQLAIFERTELRDASWNVSAVLLVIGFAIFLFSMYSLTPYMLQMCSATLFNLSLLTSDVLAIVASIFIFDTTPSFFYFLAFFIIIAGLILYNTSTESETQNENEQKRAILEESSEPPTPS
eukprot:TRINITY_DN10713_c0_g1_i1.p1 TRINITY_DN10713_c0_g1~~TRINITY_DN10713_c0_g1_i1.p1  ORF type:complete len:328 (-),score=46.54 TRINITY_DN10713_c0_g1_i1:66-1049(-)